MASRIYPKADAKTQWWETAFARGTFTGIEKILLHTTETGGWPSYASGSMAPTLTYHPKLRQWRQHNYLDRSARALLDSTATLVRENRDNVIQIEIVAYADEALARTRGHLPVSELTDAMLGDLADFIKFVRAEYGGPPLVSAKFLPYPQSAGASSVRMSGPTYDAFKGILGHQHAPAQGHGDPGALDVARILKLAGSSPTPTPAPTPLEDPMPTPAELWSVPFKSPNDGKSYAASSWLVMANVKAGEARALAQQAVARVAALEGALKAISANPSIDPAAITAAAKAGAEAALDEKISGADVTLNVTPPSA